MVIIVIDYTILVCDRDKTAEILSTLAQQFDNFQICITIKQSDLNVYRKKVFTEANIIPVEYSEDRPKNKALYERLLNFKPNTPSTKAVTLYQPTVGEEKSEAQTRETVSEFADLGGIIIIDPELTKEYIDTNEYFNYDAHPVSWHFRNNEQKIPETSYSTGSAEDTITGSGANDIISDGTDNDAITCGDDDDNHTSGGSNKLYSEFKTLNSATGWLGSISNKPHTTLQSICLLCCPPPEPISPLKEEHKTWFLGISPNPEFSENDLKRILNKTFAPIERSSEQEDQQSTTAIKKTGADVKRPCTDNMLTPLLNTGKPKTKYYAKHDSTLFQKIDTKKADQPSCRIKINGVTKIGNRKYTPFI